jgi:hypothetical protein
MRLYRHDINGAGEDRVNVLWFAVAAFVMGLAAPVWAQTPSHQMPAALKCPGDRIVWVNTRSGVYHFQGERYFGSTKEGEFICQHAADADGDRPTQNGQ